jgi:hypothetical protein
LTGQHRALHSAYAAQGRPTASRANGSALFWLFAVALTGINLWSALLAVPALHLARGYLPGDLVLLPALLVLAAGMLLRHSLILVAAYPPALLIALFLRPELLASKVYRGWPWLFVTLAWLVYLIATGMFAQVSRRYTRPDRSQPVVLTPAGRSARGWYSSALVGMSLLFPAVLSYAVFADSRIQRGLSDAYPQRAAAAAVLLGICAILLGVALFYRYLMRSVRAQSLGDPELKQALVRLRRQALDRRPRLRFYLLVGIALLLMLLLIVLR